MEENIELQIENHGYEVELRNIINLFKPYVNSGSKYKIISKVEDGSSCAKVSALILEGGQVILESSVNVAEEIRQSLKKTLYKVLCDLTGKQMPWGC